MTQKSLKELLQSLTDKEFHDICCADEKHGKSCEFCYPSSDVK